MPFSMLNKGGKVGEIRIYGEITNMKWFEEDTTPSDFQAQLDALGDIEYLNVFINSPGGGISAGTAIYNIIKRHGAAVMTSVDGIAASISVAILQAGDERVMAKNSTIYVHNPMYGICGYYYSKDLSKFSEELDKAKEPLMESFNRLKISKDKLSELMDSETTLTAAEALKMGFIDRIEDYSVSAKVENKKVTFGGVSFDSRMFKNFDISKIKNFEPEPIPDSPQQPAEPVPASQPPEAAPVDFSDYDQEIRVSQNRINTIQISTLTAEGV